MKRGLKLCVLALVLALMTGMAWGQTTVPNTFTSGTPAKAAEVNANFQALATAIDNAKLSYIQLGNVAQDFGLRYAVGFMSSGPTVAWVHFPVPFAGTLSSISYNVWENTLDAGTSIEVVVNGTTEWSTPVAAGTTGTAVNAMSVPLSAGDVIYVAVDTTASSTGSLSITGMLLGIR